MARSMRRLLKLDALKVDLLRYHDNNLYSMLYKYRGLKLVMMVESTSFDHDEIEWHAYALKYCPVKDVWFKADENRPFMTKLSFSSHKEYDWSIMIRRIKIASIEVSHVTKDSEV